MRMQSKGKGKGKNRTESRQSRIAKQTEKIAAIMIEELERLIEHNEKTGEAIEAPWVKDWKVPAWTVGGKKVNPNVQINAVSKRRYRGMNQFNLMITAMIAGFTSPLWITYNKAAELGGNIRKGSRGSTVYFWIHGENPYVTYTRTVIDPVSGLEVEEEYHPMEWNLITHSVFNIEQCENLPEDMWKLEEIDTDSYTPEPAEEAESIIAAYLANGGPEMAHDGGNRAYYVPSQHRVALPKRESFRSQGGYYTTTFHELGHSTGHHSLLGRFEKYEQLAAFGSEDYSKEELVAEFTAAFLCMETGITNVLDSTMRNSIAYIKGWLKSLKNDPKMALEASGKAQKAADLILAASVQEVK